MNINCNAKLFSFLQMYATIQQKPDRACVLAFD